MTELSSTKLNPDQHILLDQPLLRTPYELLRKNFKTAQRHVEREREHLLPQLKAVTNASLSSSTSVEETLGALDSMIGKTQALKRKLSTLHEEEQELVESSQKRIAHLHELYSIDNFADVKYDTWSKVRLDRLLVDYMLWMGYEQSARALARSKSIEPLVDISVFTSGLRIAQALQHGKLHECLQWCGENRQALKKGNFNLEFEVRMQQYIELVRTREASKLREAMAHARKYLAPHMNKQETEVRMAAGLLAYPEGTPAEPYKSLYSRSRYNDLSHLFITTYHTLLSLPSFPLLTICLSAGLSALKTPSCHSARPASTTSSNATSVCPICSIELNELARGLPYAHRTKSVVEDDPVVLPNGRIYGRDRLHRARDSWVSTVLDREGWIKDPTTGEAFKESEIRKVFIS